MVTDTDSRAVLDRLIKLHPKIIDLALDRVFDLLAALDHPEQKLPPVVHVAGTNGKGSTIAMLRAMLESAGRRVQVYTSPHLVRFHERIRMGPDLIGEAELVSLLQACEAANRGRPITYFEITTVAALLAFARDPGDILLLETGLGGRLDATNVVARPHLTVITPISMDHTQYLGGTIEEIAFEKAGILKPQVPAVVAPQLPSALAVIQKQADKVGAPLFCFGDNWDFTVAEDGFTYRDDHGAWPFPKPGLPGSHQTINGATAVACSQFLRSFLSFPSDVAQGLTTSTWPGRLQSLNDGNLQDLLGAGEWEIWLDGGHNAAAGQALADFTADWGDRPFCLIYGMLNTKAAIDFLTPLIPGADQIMTLAIPGEPNSLTAEEAAERAAALEKAASPQPSLEDALRNLARSHAGGRILICGSLYLAGHVLACDGR